MTVFKASIFVLIVFLSGCSTIQKPTFQLKNTALSEVWPKEVEMPRYRYVGELHGELANSQKGDRTALEKIIGLIQGESEPLVLKRPYDVYVGLDNTIYVADLALPGVMVFNQNDYSLKVWDEIDERTSFKAPVGIVGVEDTILVVDSQWAEIFRFSKEGQLLDSFGQKDLKRPIGIAYDPAMQRIYIADAGLHKIQVFSVKGELITSIGQYGEALGDLNYPSAIEFGNQKLYISDTMNARIQIIDPYNLEKEVESFGYRGLNIGNTPRPKGVTVDNHGHVYAVESYYGYLLVYNDEGEFLLPISGKNRVIGDFYLPTGVTTDHQDRIYLTDTFNGRIVILQYLGD